MNQGAPIIPSAAPNNSMQANSATLKLERTTAELAAVTVSNKVPDFWIEMPRVWFAQFETIMGPQKQGDETKFSLVVSKLPKDALPQVLDILTSPSDSDRYQRLKNRLIAVYEESEQQQFQKLINEMDLGDQKPSQLLRRMKSLAHSSDMSDKTIHNLWTSRLPTYVRAVLTVSKDQTLDNLAAIADQVMENHRVGEVAEVNTGSHQSVMTELISQIHKLTLEVAELKGQERRGRNYNRNFNRSRSRSRTRITRGDPRWLCKYHLRYKNQARNCEEPCTWKNKPTPSGN